MQDLRVATAIAFEMVCQFGMSEKLGPVEYGNRYKFLSSETRSVIEAEVQKTLFDAQSWAKKLLLSKRKELDLLAKALVEYETLDRKEVAKVITGEKLTDRTPVPQGPMLVPKGPNPLEDIPGLSGGSPSDEDNTKPTPPETAGEGVPRYRDA